MAGAPPAAELPPEPERPPVVDVPPVAELPPSAEFPPVAGLPPTADIPPAPLFPPLALLPPLDEIPPIPPPVPWLLGDGALFPPQAGRTTARPDTIIPSRIVFIREPPCSSRRDRLPAAGNRTALSIQFHLRAASVHINPQSRGRPLLHFSGMPAWTWRASICPLPVSPPFDRLRNHVAGLPG